MPAKLDLYKRHKDEYVTPKTPALVKVGPAKYLSVEGRGEPGGKDFTAAIGALYGSAFTIKMTRKFAGKGDYKVCNLEGQWWCDGGDEAFLSTPRDRWRWALLIRVPELITAADLKRAVGTLLKKGKGPEMERVRLVTLREGLCVQALHVGPYSDEPATVGAMCRFARASGLEFAGKHHEMYLSDPRRVAPARLRTILRHPVRKARRGGGAPGSAPSGR
jgi:hypothetical protein